MNPYGSSVTNSNDNPYSRANNVTTQVKPPQSYHHHDTNNDEDVDYDALIMDPSLTDAAASTTNTNATTTTATTAVQDAAVVVDKDAMIQNLQQQLEELQKQVDEKQEANFDLQMTMATMQAELDHTVKTVTQQAEHNTSKLQHELRLEQQKSQRLLQEQQQQSKNSETLSETMTTTSHKRSKVVPVNDDRFYKRLPRPQEPPADVTGVLPKEQSPSSSTITTTNTTSSFELTTQNHSVDSSTGASWLAQHLLLLLPSSLSSSSTPDNSKRDSRQQLQNILTMIATASSSSSSYHWTEPQLMEYLLDNPTTPEEYSYHVALWSRTVRRSMIAAMETTEATTKTTTALPKTNRIRRLENNNKGSLATATKCEEIRLALQDPWWKPGNAASFTSSSGGNLHPKVAMNPRIVQSWMTTTSLPITLYRFKIWNLVLSEIPDHSTTLWWKQGISIVEATWRAIHGRCVAPIAPAAAAAAAGSSGYNPARLSTYRLEPDTAAGKESSNEGTNGNLSKFVVPIVDDALISASLSLMKQLIRVTTIPSNTTENAGGENILQEWFLGPGRFYSEGLALVCRILDVLETLLSSYASSYQQQQQPPLPLPSWYLDAIDLFMTIGTIPSGIQVLRTRATPSRDDWDGWMPNVLDFSIRQLHQLSILDEQQKPEERRAATTIQYAWIRFWHQMLIFCQHPQMATTTATLTPFSESTTITTPTAVERGSSVSISFRSLLQDHQDLYTSACARILTNRDSTTNIATRVLQENNSTPASGINTTMTTFENVASMIRLQLEELSMDEEEEEEIRQERRMDAIRTH